MYHDVVRVEDFGHLTSLEGIQVTHHDSWGSSLPQPSFLGLAEQLHVVLGPQTKSAALRQPHQGACLPYLNAGSIIAGTAGLLGQQPPRSAPEALGAL
jgi:hypothetical protein